MLEKGARCVRWKQERMNVHKFNTLVFDTVSRKALSTVMILFTSTFKLQKLFVATFWVLQILC